MHPRPERRMVVRAYLTSAALRAIDAEVKRRSRLTGAPVSRPQVVAQVLAEWAATARAGATS